VQKFAPALNPCITPAQVSRLDKSAAMVLFGHVRMSNRAVIIAAIIMIRLESGRRRVTA
jgi:hypothetical protein